MWLGASMRRTSDQQASVKSRNNESLRLTSMLDTGPAGAPVRKKRYGAEATCAEVVVRGCTCIAKSRRP